MNRTYICLSLVICLILASCSLPDGSPSVSPEMMTAAALTVQAALNNGAGTTLTPSGAGSDGLATPTISQTGDPVLSVGEVTNCRTGPGTNFERIVQILPGEQVGIVGFLPPNYWVVSSKAGDCWMIADFATPSGSFSAVPTVTAPATPTGNPPVGVSLKFQYECNFQTGETKVTLSWPDKAEGETGYRVSRNGTVIAELPPNSNLFIETITLLSGQSVSYSVEVFSPAGSASSKTISFSC